MPPLAFALPGSHHRRPDPQSTPPPLTLSPGTSSIRPVRGAWTAPVWQVPAVLLYLPGHDRHVVRAV